MNNEYIDALETIYQACKDIPGWMDNLRPLHDPEDMEYFEKLNKLDGRK